jgi:hypothetical protein
MSTTYRKVAMSPEELPRQRLFQLMELPEPPQDFELVSGETLQNIRLLEPGEDASLIVQAEWAWSPMHSRVSNWEIGQDETKQNWVLWCSHHTDESELADWCDPDADEEDLEWVAIWSSEVVAACPRGELSEQDASMLLLLAAWIEERDGDMELDRPHFYGAIGVLNIDVIRSIERVVWE